MMSLALLAGCFLLVLPTRVNSQFKRAVAGVFLGWREPPMGQP